MKEIVKIAILFALAASAAACNKSLDNGDGTDEIKLNPDPVRISGINVYRLTFSQDEFNMISEPGFELFPEEKIDYNSLWYFEGAAKDPVQAIASDDAHGGEVSMQLDNPNDGVWIDGCLQSIALKKGKDYTMTCYGKAAWAGMNAFAGVRLEGGPINDAQVPEWNPDSWTLFTKEFNSGDYTQGNVFGGCWGYPGVWLRFDDFRLVPKGTTQTSLKSDTCTETGNFLNASFTGISSAAKAVVWQGPDNLISIALSDVESDGTVYPNAYAVSNDMDFSDGFHLAQFVSAEDGIAAVLAPSGDGETACVPTAGVTVNGVQYIHYYSLKETDPENDQAWTANFSGLLSSSDGGKTWTREGRARWSGIGHFVQAAFYQDSRYLYMFGSNAGRNTPQIYVARIPVDGEINNASEWTYWDGAEWVASDPDAAAAVTYGTASEMCVTYLASQQRYVMIYRSNTTGGLVFRDAGAPEGDWSGEKLLALDSDDGHLFSPTVLPSSVPGEIILLVSNF